MPIATWNKMSCSCCRKVTVVVIYIRAPKDKGLQKYSACGLCGEPVGANATFRTVKKAA